MKKQVDSTHYAFDRYLDKSRWASIWHQLDEVSKLKPRNILEIGPGPGVFKATATALGLEVETLDIDPDLKPDHVASVFSMPFRDGSYDVVCAFQMLEHLPFEDSLRAFAEMSRVASTAVVISLPNAAKRWPISARIPKLGTLRLSVPAPRLKAAVHQFDGEHYWELSKAGYAVDKVVAELSRVSSMVLQRTYRVHENPYHQFFVFTPRAA